MRTLKSKSTAEGRPNVFFVHHIISSWTIATVYDLLRNKLKIVTIKYLECSELDWGLCYFDICVSDKLLSAI